MYAGSQNLITKHFSVLYLCFTLCVYVKFVVFFVLMFQLEAVILSCKTPLKSSFRLVKM